MGSKHQNCNKGLWFLLGHGNGAGGERRPLQCHWFEMKKNSLKRHTEFITSWKWNIEIWPAKEKLVRGRHAPQMSSQLKTNFFALPIHEIWSNFYFLTFALRRHFFLVGNFSKSQFGHLNVRPAGHLDGTNVRTFWHCRHGLK